MYLSGVLQKNSEKSSDRNLSVSNISFLCQNKNFVHHIPCIDGEIIFVNSVYHALFNRDIVNNTCINHEWITGHIIPTGFNSQHSQYIYFDRIDFDKFLYASHTTNNSLHQVISNKIDKLMDNDYDWYEIGYEKPAQKNIDYAKLYISEFITTMSMQGYNIFIPHIYNSENGGVTLKWVNCGKILYFDILYQDSKYTKVWDDQRKTFVETKELFKSNNKELWEWLINNG